MLGDGMGFQHPEAARLYREGPWGLLSLQSLPLTVAMGTFPAGGSYDSADARSRRGVRPRTGHRFGRRGDGDGYRG